MNSAKTYIKFLYDNMGTPQTKKYYGYFLDHGQEFAWDGELLPDRYRENRRYKVKECFRNAQMLALWFPDELQYYEGIGYAIIPTEHAWIVEKATGKLFDPTWEHLKDQKAEYFGCPIDRMTLSKAMLKMKVHSTIIPSIVFGKDF